MTTSTQKIEANRKNAKKSTGPKNTSLVRLNAIKHGLLSKDTVIQSESKKELQELGKRLRMELAPQGELEIILVDRIVSSIWRMKRAIRVERDYIQAEFNDCKYNYNDNEREDIEAWNNVATKELGNTNTWLNLTRYETAIERQIYKALHELMRIQSAHKGDKPLLPLAVDVDVSKD
ncbi:MAG: hypothetical protein J7K40_03500 [candidate division Zixibacteria bacterium]|nr:hypothetical protein [candidate division Zixibacteria bacterium]